MSPISPATAEALRVRMSARAQERKKNQKDGKVQPPDFTFIEFYNETFSVLLHSAERYSLSNSKARSCGMKIGIIGRGNVASALSRTFSRSHEVRLGVRSVADPSEAPIGDVALWSEVIVLATPWGAEEEACQSIADHVDGKLVIDATNPVGMRNGRLDLVQEEPGSAAEILQARLPAAHVVKCFNQIGAEFMDDAGKLPSTPVMFAAGDEPEAKNIALTLAAEAGFEAVDGGPLSNARHLESLAMIWIWSAIIGPLGRTFGFALSRTNSRET